METAIASRFPNEIYETEQLLDARLRTLNEEGYSERCNENITAADVAVEYFQQT